MIRSTHPGSNSAILTKGSLFSEAPTDPNVPGRYPNCSERHLFLVGHGEGHRGFAVLWGKEPPDEGREIPPSFGNHEPDGIVTRDECEVFDRIRPNCDLFESRHTLLNLHQRHKA